MLQMLLFLFIYFSFYNKGLRKRVNHRLTSCWVWAAGSRYGDMHRFTPAHRRMPPGRNTCCIFSSAHRLDHIGKVWKERKLFLYSCLLPGHVVFKSNIKQFFHSVCVCVFLFGLLILHKFQLRCTFLLCCVRDGMWVFFSGALKLYPGKSLSGACCLFQHGSPVHTHTHIHTNALYKKCGSLQLIPGLPVIVLFILGIWTNTILCYLNNNKDSDVAVISSLSCFVSVFCLHQSLSGENIYPKKWLHSRSSTLNKWKPSWRSCHVSVAEK